MGMRKGKSADVVVVAPVELALDEIIYVTTNGQHFIVTHGGKVSYAFESGYHRDVTERYAHLDGKALAQSESFRISAYTQRLMQEIGR